MRASNKPGAIQFAESAWHAVGGTSAGKAAHLAALGVPTVLHAPLGADEDGGRIAALLIANVMLLIMNIPLIGLFTRMLTIPLWFLVPAIAAVSAVGVYAVHSTTFDLMLMVGLGVFGYILRKMHFPMSPLILGFVLGELLEQNLRRALSISNGEYGILWGSGIAQSLLVLAVAVLVVPPVLRVIRKRRSQTVETAKAE